jgi:pyruvate dehydrogenase E2 component (dihydrolipoamide acetyltransferase)
MYTIRLPKDKALVGPLVLADWLKREGQSVTPSDPVARVEGPGIRADIQAGVAGVLLKTVVQPGQIIEPGEALCMVGALGDRSQETGDRRDESGNRGIGESGKGRLGVGVVPILMPQAGQTMEEGTLVAWKVKPGDRIAVGQVIFDIETDKATMEVEATDAGRVAKIVAQEGQVVAVKMPVAYLAEDDALVDAYLAQAQKPEARSQKPEERGQETGVRSQKPEEGRQEIGTQNTELRTQDAQRVAQSGGRVKASPAARELAGQKGIDLATLTAGSGPGGRILSSDVATAKPGAASSARGGGLSKMRLAIARNLLWSKQNIPHFYAKRVVDGQALFATYRKTKEQFKCTVNDFVTAACAQAIREFPAFRSQFKDNALVEFDSVNIGIAVGTDQGLTVPVLIHADQMDLQTLAQKSRQLAENARAGRLEGVGQGIFTITNLGMFGVEEFLAIINPPESAILAVGALQEAVKVQDGSMVATRTMTLCLSVDHRVIDGMLSAQFLNRLKELLENPRQLVSAS